MCAGRGNGLPLLSPCTPFSASGILLLWRSGRVPLDEAEHLSDNQNASVASLRRCSSSARNGVRLSCEPNPPPATAFLGHLQLARHRRRRLGPRTPAASELFCQARSAAAQRRTHGAAPGRWRDARARLCGTVGRAAKRPTRTRRRRPLATTSDRNTPASAHSARRVFHWRGLDRTAPWRATVGRVRSAGTPLVSQAPRSARRFLGLTEACHQPE